MMIESKNTNCDHFPVSGICPDKELFETSIFLSFRLLESGRKLTAQFVVLSVELSQVRRIYKVRTRYGSCELVILERKKSNF